jgi:hypothetical protein
VTVTRTQPYNASQQKDTDGNYYWQKESELLNHRLTWLGATQSFLFAGLVFSQGFDFKICQEITLFGFATSMAVLLGALAAVFAQMAVGWTAKKNIFLFGAHRVATLMGWFAAVALPTLFAYGWFYLYCAFADGKFDPKPGTTFELSIGNFEMRLNK